MHACITSGIAFVSFVIGIPFSLPAYHVRIRLSTYYCGLWQQVKCVNLNKLYSVVKDTLASAKSIYHLLMIVSTIIFIVSLNMKRIKDPYDRALFEINRTEDTLKALAKTNRARFVYANHFIVLSEQDLLEMVKRSRSKDEIIDSLTNRLNELILEDKANMRILKQYLRESLADLKELQSLVPISRDNGNEQLADSLELTAIPKQRSRIREIQGFLAKGKVDFSDRPNVSPYDMFSKEYKPDSVTLIQLSAQSVYSDTTIFAYIFDEYPEFIRLVRDNNHKPINEVKELLSEKSEEFKKSKQSDIELLGLKLNIDNSHIIAPFACVALEMYLLALLWHVFILLRTTSSAHIVREYPWIFLFENILSYTISIASLSFVLLATVNLLSKSLMGDWWRWLYWSYAITNLVLMVIITLLAMVIRKKARESSDIDGI